MARPGAALLPRPRHLRWGRGRVTATDESSLPVALGAHLPPEGYRLRVGDRGPEVEAADPAGAAHARRTLGQLRDGDGNWPHVEVLDHPDLAVRGVMVDVSRDRVPTTASLLALVEQLAAWKLNHLQLYVEHTFTHPGHEEVWRTASPLTPDEVRAVADHARRHHVELVANQNTLGHMARFLVRDRYRHLALAPDGFRLMGLRMPPMTLDPAAPGSWELARGLARNWTEVLPGGRLHVGLDEPFELPAARLGEYAAWIARLRAEPWAAGRELLVWGDVVAAHPRLSADLPEGVTVCEWGYEADHPWADRLAPLAGAGVPRWVCPGTSSWDSLLGRTSNMVRNVAAAVDAAGADGGVSGLLVTDWGDWGHLQPAEVSLPGFAWAAALAWCRDANRDLDLRGALDATASASTGTGFGAALMALGDAHTRWPTAIPNVAAPFLHLWLPQLPVFGGGPADLDAVRGALDAAAALGDPGADVRTAVELVQLVLDDAAVRLEGDGRLESVGAAQRRELAARVEGAMDAHASAWHRRSRPGGLPDSLAWLRHWRDALWSGSASPDWGGPLSPPTGARPDGSARRSGSRPRGPG